MQDAFLTKAELRKIEKRYRQSLQTFQALLRECYHIHFQLYLIGSGGRKLVMRNADGSFDLDYNLVFSKLSKQYLENPRMLKDTVRVALDKQLYQCGFALGEDSTSVITYRYQNRKELRLKLDFGLWLCRKGKTYERLIHQKSNPERFLWNQVMDTAKLNSRFKKIKEANQFKTLQQVYARLKEQYAGDENYSSFGVFSMAVNEVTQVCKLAEEPQEAQEKKPAKAAKKKKKSKENNKRNQIYQLFGGHCAYCGAKLNINEMEIDHVWPKGRGGGNQTNNLWPCCHDCNRKKADMTIDEWREQIIRQCYENRNRYGSFACQSAAQPQCHFYFEKS